MIRANAFIAALLFSCGLQCACDLGEFTVNTTTPVLAKAADEFSKESDVTLARATVVVSDAASGAPLPPAAAALVEGSVRVLVDALRALGGEASTAATKTTVRCRVATAPERPFGVPLSRL